jgi:4-amino-4-deoxy-L-arabinose transferase-like glycosyltransferase
MLRIFWIKQVKKQRFAIAFLLVVFLALFLRGWQFGNLPASLYFEEPALGYDAYSIFKTGKDMHGNSFPVVAFASFGDYKPSGYFYLTAPFVGIFGMSEISVRLPSLILGMITVISVMFMAQAMFRERLVTIFSGLAIALMPTAVHLSRAAFEVNAAVGLLSISLASLLWTKKKAMLLPISVIFLAASMYTYHSLRLVAPLLFLLTVFFFLGPITLIRQKVAWASAGLFILLILPILIAIRSPEVVHRFQEVAFFPHYSQAVAITNAKRAEHANTLLSRVVYHRYWIQAQEFSQNVLMHFSPDFLLRHGDGNLRHQDTSKGLLYWWMAIAVTISVLVSARRKSGYRKFIFFIIVGLIVSAMPAGLAVPVPHTLRNHTAVLWWSLLVGWAAAKLFSNTRTRPYLLIGLSMLAFAETTAFWGNYFSDYNQKSFADWGYGYKQVATFIKNQTSNNESIYLTRDYGRPITYMLFYLQANPREVQVSGASAPKDQQELLSFQNIDFIDNQKEYDWRIESRPLTSSAYTLQGIIEDPNHNPVFYVHQKNN